MERQNIHVHMTFTNLVDYRIIWKYPVMVIEKKISGYAEFDSLLNSNLTFERVLTSIYCEEMSKLPFITCWISAEKMKIMYFYILSFLLV